MTLRMIKHYICLIEKDNDLKDCMDKELDIIQLFGMLRIFAEDFKNYKSSLNKEEVNK